MIVEKIDKVTGDIIFKYKIIPHDFEGFVNEYDIFKDWRNDLPELKNVILD